MAASHCEDIPSLKGDLKVRMEILGQFSHCPNYLCSDAMPVTRSGGQFPPARHHLGFPSQISPFSQTFNAKGRVFQHTTNHKWVAVNAPPDPDVSRGRLI